MAFCNKELEEDFDPITGEYKVPSDIRTRHNILNGNNQCKYYKDNRWFPKKDEKKLCMNCKYWYKILMHDCMGY